MPRDNRQWVRSRNVCEECFLIMAYIIGEIVQYQVRSSLDYGVIAVADKCVHKFISIMQFQFLWKFSVPYIFRNTNMHWIVTNLAIKLDEKIILRDWLLYLLYKYLIFKVISIYLFFPDCRYHTILGWRLINFNALGYISIFLLDILDFIECHQISTRKENWWRNGSC